MSYTTLSLVTRLMEFVAMEVTNNLLRSLSNGMIVSEHHMIKGYDMVTVRMSKYPRSNLALTHVSLDIMYLKRFTAIDDYCSVIIRDNYKAHRKGAVFCKYV